MDIRQSPTDYSFNHTRKDTWPQQIEHIIRNCCQCCENEAHLVAENNLCIKVVTNQNGSLSVITDETVLTIEKRENTPFAKFPKNMDSTKSKETATHLLQCLLTSSLNNKSAVVLNSTQCGGKQLLGKTYKCSSCERTFVHKSTLLKHERFQCRPHPLDWNPNPYRTRLSNLPLLQLSLKESVTVKPRKRLQLVEENVKFPAKKIYVESLGLIPQSKAFEIQDSTLKKVVKCNVLELGDENVPPALPLTPSCRKSLITQFRDASPTAYNKSGVKSNITSKSEDTSEGSRSDSEEESVGTEKPDENYRPRRVVSLLNIDITSLLGNRVLKHIKKQFENMGGCAVPLNGGYECYCRTPIKSNSFRKLRNRGEEFQITFKKTKRTAPKYCHKYKFSRAELRDFCRQIETGLNKRSRRLRRKMKKCTVVLEPLSEDEIRHWCPDYVVSSRCEQKLDIEDENLRKSDFSTSTNSDYAQVRFAWDNQSEMSGTRGTDTDTSEEDDDIIILEDLEVEDKPAKTSHENISSHRSRRKSPLVPRQWVDDGDSKIEDDVISISSSDSENELTESTADLDNFSSSNSEGTREPLHPSALLFKCHICSEEIICVEDTNVYIKQHFASSHNVHNIELIAHLDACGQKVFSIIEVSPNEKQEQCQTRQNSSKRWRAPLTTRDENNLPASDTKTLPALRKQSCKSSAKVNLKPLGSMQSGRITKNSRKATTKTKSSASKTANVSSGSCKTRTHKLISGKRKASLKKHSASGGHSQKTTTKKKMWP